VLFLKFEPATAFMTKGKRATPRASSKNEKTSTTSHNNKLTISNKENMKRISLFFHRLTNINSLSYNQSTWIDHLNSKALSGSYFVLLNSRYEIVSENSSEGIHPGVNWSQLAGDIQSNLDLLSLEVSRSISSPTSHLLRGLRSESFKRKLWKKLIMKLRGKGRSKRLRPAQVIQRTQSLM
jgi:hypothetical protein